MAGCSCLVIFFTSKVLCFGTHRQVTCEMFIVKRSEDLVEKIIDYYIFSSSVGQKSFIQMVKYSFPDKRVISRSFYSAPLTFCYFYLHGKLYVLARVSKLLAWTLFLVLQKCYLSVVLAP